MELNWTLYLAFLLVGIVAAITPGPTILLTLSQSLSFDQKRMASTLMGLITGSILFGLITLYGTGMLLIGAPHLLKIIKILGAAILLYFGILKLLNNKNTNKELKKEPIKNSSQDYLLGLFTAVL